MTYLAPTTFTPSHDVLYTTAAEILSLTRREGKMINLFPVLSMLTDRYSEAWRIYHTLEHIADGLQKLWSVRAQLADPVATYIAWICHDVIYIPRCADNELRSAEFAVQLARQCGVSEERTRVIYQMVKATKNHLVPNDFVGNQHDLALMLDVDLSGLADEKAKYLAVGEQLRIEAGLTTDEFMIGNAGFSNILLGRQRIYQTDAFVHLEPAARTNLTGAVQRAQL